MPAFTSLELQQFARDGFVIARALARPAERAAMRAVSEAHLAGAVGPLEYESDVGYPGAPPSKQAPGGTTVRRLLQAYARDPVFAAWARDPRVLARVRQLLGPQVLLPQAHHNCIMTKQPQFSSATHWHQDVRYWSYTQPNLVNVWLALGSETIANGCLLLLPGTHTLQVERARLDAALFLRADLKENAALIATAVAAPLAPGDVLFFHARSFHAAGRNTTQEPKFSVVFTYREAANLPVAGSRSAAHPDIVLD